LHQAEFFLTYTIAPRNSLSPESTSCGSGNRSPSVTPVRRGHRLKPLISCACWSQYDDSASPDSVRTTRGRRQESSAKPNRKNVERRPAYPSRRSGVLRRRDLDRLDDPKRQSRFPSGSSTNAADSRARPDARSLRANSSAAARYRAKRRPPQHERAGSDSGYRAGSLEPWYRRDSRQRAAGKRHFRTGAPWGRPEQTDDQRHNREVVSGTPPVATNEATSVGNGTVHDAPPRCGGSVVRLARSATGDTRAVEVADAGRRWRRRPNLAKLRCGSRLRRGETTYCST
jgi:hypothetical protein